MGVRLVSAGAAKTFAAQFQQHDGDGENDGQADRGLPPRLA